METPDAPQISRSTRFQRYLSHLWETLKEAPFGRGWWLHFAITGIGVAGVAWLIPSINASHTNAETIGVYVLGILLAVLSDALFAWKKTKDDPVCETVLVVAFLLSIWTFFLSTKKWVVGKEGISVGEWREFSEYLLILIFILTAVMWAMLNVVEPKFNNPVTQGEASLGNLGR